VAIAAGSKYRSTVLSQILKRVTLQWGTTESSYSLSCWPSIADPRILSWGTETETDSE